MVLGNEITGLLAHARRGGGRLTNMINLLFLYYSLAVKTRSIDLLDKTYETRGMKSVRRVGHCDGQDLPIDRDFWKLGYVYFVN